MPIINNGSYYRQPNLIAQKNDVRVLFKQHLQLIITATALNISFNFYDTLNLQYVFKKENEIILLYLFNK